VAHYGAGTEDDAMFCYLGTILHTNERGGKGKQTRNKPERQGTWTRPQPPPLHWGSVRERPLGVGGKKKLPGQPRVGSQSRKYRGRKKKEQRKVGGNEPIRKA